MKKKMSNLLTPPATKKVFSCSSEWTFSHDFQNFNLCVSYVFSVIPRMGKWQSFLILRTIPTPYGTSDFTKSWNSFECNDAVINPTRAQMKMKMSWKEITNWPKAKGQLCECSLSLGNWIIRYQSPSSYPPHKKIEGDFLLFFMHDRRVVIKNRLLCTE